ncbi:MAG: CPBP family intramembrane glutamic endopeptidase, partial [Polyangia bacterium]
SRATRRSGDRRLGTHRARPLRRRAKPSVSRADRFAVVAVVAWIACAVVARTHGLWIGVGLVSIALGAAALALDGVGLFARLQPSAARLVLGAAVGGAMTAATYALFPLAVRLAPSSAHEAQRLYASFATLSPALAVALLAPVIVGEELVWRGVVQGALARHAGAVAGVLLAAALYAIAHAAVGSSLLVVVAFGCGLVWSTLRALTGDLIAPLVAHAMWDLCVLVLHPLAR